MVTLNIEEPDSVDVLTDAGGHELGLRQPRTGVDPVLVYGEDRQVPHAEQLGQDRAGRRRLRVS